MPALQITHRASFARLRDRSWGVRISPIDYAVQGDDVTVTRRDGTTTVVTLAHRVARNVDHNYALYAVQRDERRVERNTLVNEALATPAESTRTGRMILAGGVDATVALPNGEHVTIYARALHRGRSTRDPSTRGRSGRADGARIRLAAGRRGRTIGWVYPHGAPNYGIDWTRGTSDAVKTAVRALFDSAASGDDPYYRIQIADACGRCGRELTDPESIVRGIGPDCFGHVTASRHAEVGASGLTFSAPTTAEPDVYTPRIAAPVERLTDMAARLTPTAPTGSVSRSRELIYRALVAYGEDEHATDAQIEDALRTFDSMAARS